MTTDLDQIIAGVAMRRAMDRDDDLINDSIRIEQLAEVLDVRLELRWLFFSAKDAISNRDRFRASETHERDRAFAGRGRDRSDGLAGKLRLLVRAQLVRVCSTSFSAAMHAWFCSMVPTEMRTHSGRL